MKFKHYLTLIAIFSFSIMRSQSGTHLNFDGVDDYVEIPNESNFDFTNQITVEFWINSSETPQQWDALVAKGDDSWRVALTSDGTVAFAGTGAFSDFYSTTAVNDGNWHHVAATYNGANAIIYIDGVLENSIEATANIDNSAFNVSLGENLQQTGRFFSGNLEDVRIWNVARTEEQINASKRCELLGSESGLLAYYKFNQGLDNQDNTAITSLTDATVNANNGTLTNFELTAATSNWKSGSLIITGQNCCTSVTTWNGTAWSNGTPDATKTAIFTGNYTGLGFDACSVQVNGTANVSINSGENLEIQNEVQVASAASFSLENNTNLVQVSDRDNLGNAIVKRNSTPMIRLDYTAWSSPVAGQKLLSFSPNTLTNRFYSYSPSGVDTASAWIPVSAPSTTDFAEGNGYLIRVDNTWSASTAAPYSGQFSGVLNNGPVTVATTTGYNLIGNPYPSTVSVADFISANSTLGVSTLYYWTHTIPASGGVYAQNNYASRTTLGGVASAAGGAIPNAFIQVGQGFFTQTTSDGDLVFNNTMRSNDTSNQFFKTAAKAPKNKSSRFWLNLNGVSANYNQILVGYATGATNDYDQGVDGKLLTNSKSYIASKINGDNYVIQGRAEAFDINDEVAVGFTANQDGDYTIALDSFDGLFTNQDIFLWDKLSNTKHNLKQSAYTFKAVAGTNDSRFTVVYKTDATLGTDTFTKDSQVVYVDANNYIQIENSNQLISKVDVYDVSGKVLYSKTNIQKNQVTVQKSIKNQVVLVKITLQDGSTNTQKIIK